MELAQVFPSMLFVATALYLSLMYGLAFRLGWLRRHRDALDAPSTLDFIYGKLGFVAVAFLWSRRHRQLGDPVVSGLVLAVARSSP